MIFFSKQTRRLVLITLTAFLATNVTGGETDTSEGFLLALPGYSYSFPRDHFAHPKFRTEWWYFTGHLRDLKSGGRFGYEVTFFRNALAKNPTVPKSQWALRDIHFAHFAISDIKEKSFWFSEKVNRGALGQAGEAVDQLHVWIDDWTLTERKGIWHIKAEFDDRSLDLDLRPAKKEIIHGKNGVSQKSEGMGKATHYISLTRMKTSGTLSIKGRSYSVEGDSWYDHEFGSNQLASDQVGWDWFSLQFENGEELMIYLLRKKDGCFDLCSSGTWIFADGKSEHLSITDLSVISRGSWKSPKTSAVYPAEWEIRVPRRKLNVRVQRLIPDQELVVTKSAHTSYWEGACKIEGSHTGNAYVELTGYGESLPSGK